MSAVSKKSVWKVYQVFEKKITEISYYLKWEQIEKQLPLCFPLHHPRCQRTCFFCLKLNIVGVLQSSVVLENVCLSCAFVYIFCYSFSLLETRKFILLFVVVLESLYYETTEAKGIARQDKFLLISFWKWWSFSIIIYSELIWKWKDMG